MDRYISLIAESANKSAYRKRPIKTLDEVQKLAQKGKEKTIRDKLKQKETSSTKTPRRFAITEAKKKAGRKAFKEMTKQPNEKLNELLYKKRVMELQGATASEIERINKDIDEVIAKQKKSEDLAKSLEKYKDDPLLYFTKLQEVKQELDKEQGEKQLKAIEAGTSKTEGLLSSMLTPRQLLEQEPEFAALSGNEKKAVEDKLRKSTRGDKSKRMELVRQILSERPEVKQQIIQQTIEGVPKSKSVGRPKVVNTIKKDALADVRFDDKKMKKYVSDKLFSDDSENLLDIESNITKYMKEFEERSPKKFDILFQQADDDEEQQFQGESSIAESIQQSAEEKADEEMPRLSLLDEPIEFNMVETIKQEMIDEGTPEPLAQADAQEAVQATKYELNKNAEPQESQELQELKRQLKDAYSRNDIAEASKLNSDILSLTLKQAPLPVVKKLPSQLPVVEELPPVNYLYSNQAFPGDTKINKMSIREIQKFAKDNSLTVPDDVSSKGTMSAHRKWLLGVKKGKGFSPKASGEGFKPIKSFPHHLIAGTLAKHIDRVRNRRFKQNVKSLAVHNNLDNEEYRQKLKQHLLRGGGFGDWFFKGLTAPFALASKIPLPGLQQIGQIGTKAFNAIGAPTFF